LRNCNRNSESFSGAAQPERNFRREFKLLVVLMAAASGAE
jgi:hypothetical protein